MAEQPTPPVEGGQQPVPPPDKSFSQTDVDRVVKERLERERQKYADYDQLKTAAQRLKELEDGQKSEAQKLADRMAEIEKALGLKDQTIEKLQGELTGSKRANLAGSVANRLGAFDPQDANILAAISAIDPAGANAETEIEAALKGLQERKPYLFRQAGATQKPGVEAFNPGSGGGAAESDAQRVARLQRLAGAKGFGPLG
ncbi:MAG: hypothetical protein WC869_16600 [Phycisphaerae bacterium]